MSSLINYWINSNLGFGSGYIFKWFTHNLLLAEFHQEWNWRYKIEITQKKETGWYCWINESKMNIESTSYLELWSHNFVYLHFRSYCIQKITKHLFQSSLNQNQNTCFYVIIFSYIKSNTIVFLNRSNVDIDECEMKTANCGPDEICKNKPGGYTCSCPAGHSLNAQRRCEDINECEFYRGQVKFKKNTQIKFQSQQLFHFEIDNCYL